MVRKGLLRIGLTAGVSAFVLVACDTSTWNQEETSDIGTSSEVSANKTACVDPATGELLEPGADAECSVPAPTASAEKPVVRDLEGGGKAIDLSGKLKNNEIKPAGGNRVAVIDPRTGELLTERPDDDRAAASYDRIFQRAQILISRQANTSAVKATLSPEVMASGGMKIDFKGRFQVPLVAKLSEDGKVELQHQR